MRLSRHSRLCIPSGLFGASGIPSGLFGASGIPAGLLGADQRGTDENRRGGHEIVLLDEDLTRSVIGAFFTVYNKLGHGFLENVYVGALAVELERRGHRAEREVPIAVEYEGVIVGTYRADLMVEGRLVLEVKAAEAINREHTRQLRNYLACTNLELGLVLCFGLKPEFRRHIDTRAFKAKRRASVVVSADSV